MYNINWQNVNQAVDIKFSIVEMHGKITKITYHLSRNIDSDFNLASA